MRLTRLRGPRRSDGFSLLEVIVAMAILGVGIVWAIQLFAGSLRTTKKTENYSIGLIHARALLEDAYALADPEDAVGDFDFEDGFSGRVDVTSMSYDEDEGVNYYEIKVAVIWPPSGTVNLSAIRSVHEKGQQ